jgi:hypothetical protein
MPNFPFTEPPASEKLMYNSSKKPPLGRTFRILKAEKPDNNYARHANRFAGNHATVRAYWGCHGIWASVTGAEGLMEIPYDQCDWT